MVGRDSEPVSSAPTAQHSSAMSNILAGRQRLTAARYSETGGGEGEKEAKGQKQKELGLGPDSGIETWVPR